MAKLSTEAQIGKIVLLIGIVLGVISLAFIFTMGSVGLLIPGLTGVLTGLVYVVGVVAIVGIVLQFLAYRKAAEGRIHDGGIFALIAAFVPPLQILPLIAAILLLVSPEAKKRK
jgi:hypothetical protein